MVYNLKRLSENRLERMEARRRYRAARNAAGYSPIGVNYYASTNHQINQNTSKKA